MKKSVIIAAAGLQALFAYGQNAAYQVISDGGGPVMAKVLSSEAMMGNTVTGKPFSAVEERHSVQILGDGTRIESKTSDKFFRDDQGRTRIERQDGSIMIQDPVQGISAEITANGHVMRRNSFAYKATTTGSGAVLAVAGADAVKMDAAKMKAEADMKLRTAVSGQVGGIITTQMTEVNRKMMDASGEDLGYQSVNGVTAKGVRNTNTIPVGKIGNDRPITVTSERWFSSDLGMLVKSSNSDPRFGETSYDLTNVLQVTQDPSLFQIPANSSRD